MTDSYSQCLVDFMFCVSFCLPDQQIHVREQAEVFLCRRHKIRFEETHDPHVPLHTPGTVIVTHIYAITHCPT